MPGGEAVEKTLFLDFMGNILWGAENWSLAASGPHAFPSLQFPSALA
jgi:hypothetical protein